jgi:predicted MPP superfamily phosphohydrolase
MALFIILIITEILAVLVIRQHFFDKSWISYYFVITLNAVMSIWLWILWFEAETFNGSYDEPENVWIMMNLAGMISAVVVPRIIASVFHFSGRLERRRTGGHNRRLTNTGLIISVMIFVILGISTLLGRFNFRTEEYTVKIKGLHEDLNGLRIVQLSDLHLSCFHHHRELIAEVVEEVNGLKPDLIINTGDFITYGWREFNGFDTILANSKARYGSYAVLGNHDFGTYQPFFTKADLENNVSWMNKLVRSSGYDVLNDEHSILAIGEAEIAIIGVKTKGSFPDIIHGDLAKATDSIGDVDLKILLSHDPNHWEKATMGKTDIDLTLAGHTHGMQMGIYTKSFSWSPAIFFYKRWGGLYTEGDQHLVVNRGLGVLGIPFRIWMPPEISLVTLVPE